MEWADECTKLWRHFNIFHDFVLQSNFEAEHVDSSIQHLMDFGAFG